jgi:hypothetical protein
MSIKFHNLNVSLLKVLILSFSLPILPIFSGLRVDQLILYTLFMFNVFYQARNPQLFNLDFKNIRGILLISFIILLSLFSTIINYKVNFKYSLASFENLLNPLCICTVFYINYSYKRIGAYNTDYLIKYSLFFFFLNTCISIVSIFFDIGDYMNYYLDTEDRESVWHRSYALSRFIGFFGQPVEAGFAYSSIYLLYLKFYKQKNYFKKVIINIIIIIGGIITTSKVFYITLFLVLIFRAFNYNKKIIYLIFFISIPIIYSLLINVLQYFFATRYLETSNFLDDFLFIYNNNFFLGLGLMDTISDNPLDNAYLQIFLLSGLVGIIVYLLLIFFLVPNDNFNKKYSVYNTIFFVLIFLGGLGSPVLTLNKANFFIILYSFFHFFNSKRSIP